MSASYRTTFTISNRQVLEGADGTALVGDLAASNAYVGAIINGIYTVLDMAALQSKSPIPVDETLPIGVFISDHLTDMNKDTAAVTGVIPLRDMYTKRFNSRMITVDPHTDSNTTVSYTSMRTPDIRDDVYRQEWLNDLVINSTTYDLNNSLVAINGLFHRTVVHEGELYVAGGYANMKRTQNKETVLLDTSAIGGHTTINITEDMISASGDDRPLSEGLYLTLPDEHVITGKAAAVVIHGQLHLFEDSYRVVGTNRIKVRMNQIDLVHLIMHHPMTKYTRKYRAPGLVYPSPQLPQDPEFVPALYDDTSPLYSDAIDDGGMVDRDALISDENIIQLLTEGQSFVILFNNSQIYTRRYDLYPVGRPGQYETVSEDTPRGILRYNGCWTLPYTIMSSSERQHIVSVAALRIGDDLYKTALDQSAIPAPWLDSFKDKKCPSVHLLELYTS